MISKEDSKKIEILDKIIEKVDFSIVEMEVVEKMLSSIPHSDWRTEESKIMKENDLNKRFQIDVRKTAIEMKNKILGVINTILNE